jgi:hypothetical protein
MSFGVSHGAADSIVIWKTFTKVKMKAIAFLIYLLIVFLGLLLWFQSPSLGLIILLLMSIHPRYGNEIKLGTLASSIRL